MESPEHAKKPWSLKEKDTEQDSSSRDLALKALLNNHKEELGKQAQEATCTKYRHCPALLLRAHFLLRCLQN